MMLVGVPGAGKSFFARGFSKVFSIPVVSFDEIQYTLFAQPQFTKEEEILIAHVMRLQIVQLLKTGKPFIIDGSLNTYTSRLAIENLADKSGYKTLTIWIQTDDISAMIRSLKRSPKKPGDKFNHPLTKEQFIEKAQTLQTPQERENHVVISGKHTFASQVQTVLKKIIKPREAIVEQTQPPRSKNSPNSRTPRTVIITQESS